MRIGILCAGDSELAPFLSCLENPAVTEKAMLKFYEGTLCGIPVTALYCGVCKVNAAIAVQILIDTFRVDAVINAGTAGGMDERLEIFDTVAAQTAAYHDVAEDILTEFHPWMPAPRFLSDPRLLEAARTAARRLGRRIWFGPVVTGEQFIDQEHREEILEQFAPLAADMETAAAAHVCYVNQVPFLALRTITDTAKNSGVGTFEENCQKASAIARDLTLLVLEELKKEPLPLRVNTPLLVTDRLILRRFEPGDVQAVYEIFSDPTVNRFLPWYPLKDLSQARQYLEEHFLSFYENPPVSGMPSAKRRTESPSAMYRFPRMTVTIWVMACGKNSGDSRSQRRRRGRYLRRRKPADCPLSPPPTTRIIRPAAG